MHIFYICLLEAGSYENLPGTFGMLVIIIIILAVGYKYSTSFLLKQLLEFTFLGLQLDWLLIIKTYVFNFSPQLWVLMEFKRCLNTKT